MVSGPIKHFAKTGFKIVITRVIMCRKIGPWVMCLRVHACLNKPTFAEVDLSIMFTAVCIALFSKHNDQMTIICAFSQSAF